MSRDIVLITVDSLRADHLGCYGYDRDTTPYLDVLAESSHVFSNAFSHACSTRPSFPSILTSTYPEMYGGFEKISERRSLISEILKDNGYTTACFNSNPFLSAVFGYNRGFDKFFDFNDEFSLVGKIRDFIKNNVRQYNLLYAFLSWLFSSVERRTGVEIGSAYVKADVITDKAIKWVHESKRTAPRFLWIHYMDVHHPYDPPERYQDAFREIPVPGKESVRLRRKLLERPAEITDEELENIIDLYDAEIRFTDAQINRLISTVKSAWEDPIVVITADHGEEFRDHGRFSHHNTFHDEIIHVPLIINDDGVKSTQDDMVGLVDVAPTLTDYAGLDIPDEYYGTSIRSILDGDEKSSKIVGYNFCRSSEWKYILKEKTQALYNLTDDLDETVDVLEDYEEVAAELRDHVNHVRDLVKETSEELGEIEMNENIREKLSLLGYKN